jgi:hypothetical protein
MVANCAAGQLQSECCLCQVAKLPQDKLVWLELGFSQPKRVQIKDKNSENSAWVSTSY